MTESFYYDRNRLVIHTADSWGSGFGRRRGCFLALGGGVRAPPPPPHPFTPPPHYKRASKPLVFLLNFCDVHFFRNATSSFRDRFASSTSKPSSPGNSTHVVLLSTNRLLSSMYIFSYEYCVILVSKAVLSKEEKS